MVPNDAQNNYMSVETAIKKALPRTSLLNYRITGLSDPDLSADLSAAW